MLLRLKFALLLSVVAANASAHQLGAALIKVQALPQQQISVELHAPLDAAGRPPAIATILGDDCNTVSHGSHAEARAVVRHWLQQCQADFAPRTIKVTGLNAQTPDALMVVDYASGEIVHLSANRQNPTVSIPLADAAEPPALKHYLPMGFTHIAGGYDHLILVLLLCLMARSKQLLWVVTSFTLAHSASLALATLGHIQAPALVVESCIALSLMLLAAELLRQVKDSSYSSITLRYPAAMAFTFGLIHGLGFAGALAETGLPDDAAWQALLLFNIGVELGQLAFVAVLLSLYAIASSTVARQVLPKIKPPMLYGIGGLAAFWFWQRLLF